MSFALNCQPQNPLLLADLVTLPRVYDVLRENNGQGQTLGLLQPVLLLLGLPLAAILWRRQRRHGAILLAGLTVMGLAIVWLQLPDATPVWAVLPALNVLPFPLASAQYAGVRRFFAALGYLLLTVPQSGTEMAGAPADRRLSWRCNCPSCIHN